MKLEAVFEKLIKGGKNKKTAVIAVAGFAVIFILFASEMLPKSTESKAEQGAVFSSAQYCADLEKRAQEIVSSIEGAGETKIMITLAETGEYVYAKNNKNTNKSSNSSNDISSQQDYVIIDDSGLLLKTTEPRVKGVAVVCEGGDNLAVQQQIYSALGALLNVSSARISVSKLSTSEVKK